MAILTGTTGDFVRAVLSSHPYKPGQGKYARWGTFAALEILVFGGVVAWSQTQPDSAPLIKWGLPLAVACFVSWVVFRLIHYPRFADFLISTQGEMTKVSWPSWNELKASTIVIIASMVLMSLFLVLADLIWNVLLRGIGILRAPLGPSQNASPFPVVPSLIDWISPWVG